MSTALSSGKKPFGSGFRIRLVTAGVLLLISCGGFLYGRASSRARPFVNGLLVSEETLDFGRVWEQPEFKWEFTVSNPTQRDLRVLDVHASCSCTTISPKAFTIPAKGQQRLSLTINLTSRHSATNQKEFEPFEVSLIPIVEDLPQRPKPWKISGEVRSALMSCPSEINFSDDCVQGREFPTREFLIRTFLANATVESKMDPQYGSATVCQMGPQEFKIIVALKPELPRGPFSSELSLTCDSSGNTVLPPSTKVTVSGVVTADVRSSSKAIAFGAVDLDSEPQEEITLYSTSGRPFKVTDVRILDVGSTGALQANIATIEAGEARDNLVPFRVQLRAVSAGTASKLIRFTIRQGEDKQYDLHVRLSAVVLALPIGS